MKLLLSLIALVSLGIFTPNLYADNLDLSLGALGLGNVTVAGSTVAGVEDFTYTNADLDLLGRGGLLQVHDFTFDATLADVLGVETLTVDETCVIVDLLHVKHSCRNLSFTLADLGLGPATLVSAGAAIGANVDGTIAGADLGASIGGGRDVFTFPTPPTPPNPPSATPEPGSLCLLGTGLLGVAGAVRRRMFAV